jgi:hypothetical protein
MGRMISKMIMITKRRRSVLYAENQSKDYKTTDIFKEDKACYLHY